MTRKGETRKWKGGSENEKQIPHPRSPKAGDRIRDDNVGSGMTDGGGEVASGPDRVPEMLGAGGTRGVQCEWPESRSQPATAGWLHEEGAGVNRQQGCWRYQEKRRRRTTAA